MNSDRDILIEKVAAAQQECASLGYSTTKLHMAMLDIFLDKLEDATQEERPRVLRDMERAKGLVAKMKRRENISHKILTSQQAIEVNKSGAAKAFRALKSLLSKTRRITKKQEVDTVDRMELDMFFAEYLATITEYYLQMTAKEIDNNFNEQPI